MSATECKWGSLVIALAGVIAFAGNYKPRPKVTPAPLAMLAPADAEPQPPAIDADGLTWAAWVGAHQDWLTQREIAKVDAPGYVVPADYADPQLENAPVNDTVFRAATYTIELSVDGVQSAVRSVDTQQQLDEELVALAIRWAKPPVRYPIDPDTGLPDLAHPSPSPVVKVRIWAPLTGDGGWVDANGKATMAPDGWFGVEVTVHVGPVNK